MVKAYQDRFTNSYDLKITEDYLILTFSRDDVDPIDIAVFSKSDIRKRVSVLQNENQPELDFSLTYKDLKMFSFPNEAHGTLDITLSYGKDKDILMVINPVLTLSECELSLNDYVNGVFGKRKIARNKI
ncbi:MULTISPECIES: hypothetical protein [Enterococcus]|uniref:hypothetical protein n=1 Tax=Enterococcus TaxID=1350 RepID=UPI000A3A786B|nr:hypothetical protein [Enterococcus sp. 4E1_DIV0656]OTO09268.1 hypothetical protein A5882_003601 [Enterococcus sp. 4E1_DIV0656]